MKTILHLLLSASLFVAASNAMAATVTFDGTSGGLQTYLGTNVSYTENGITVTAPSGSYFFLDSPNYGYGSPNPNGTDHAQIDGSFITITAGSPFSLLSLEAGTAYSYVWASNADIITVIGHLSGSTATLSQLLNIAPGTIWSTISLAGWDNLSSVDIYGTQNSYSLFVDSINATVSPVPIPAAVWLFGSALAGLVSLARRQQSA